MKSKRQSYDEELTLMGLEQGGAAVRLLLTSDWMEGCKNEDQDFPCKERSAGLGIDVCVNADNGQQIAKVEIRVNDSPVVQDYPRELLDSWEQQVTQKGVYPGGNKVEVTVDDQDGDETRAEQKW